MNDFLEFFLQLLSQFAGGPGPMENNLVRFSIPAVTYGVLLAVAWSRQRNQNLPREKLLVWGFGLGCASALLMAMFVSLQMLDVINRESIYAILVPVERAFMMASIIVVAGAFIRYILDDPRLTRNYLVVGLAITFLCMVIALWQWPSYLATLTEDRFHTSMVSSLFQIFSSILIIVAILLLSRKRDWLAKVVTIALMFFLIGELLFLLNYATDKKYNRIICPIGNSFPILAIPLLGYVYLREQSIEKKRTQEELETHRDHLEELVMERTAEISTVNAQLKDEVHERKKAEEALAQLSHEYELILESAGEGICGLDCQGRFSFVNPAAARLLGYRVDELVGQPSQILCHQSGADKGSSFVEKCPIYEGYTHGVPSRKDDQLFWRKDKTSFPVHFVSNPTYENGTLTGAVVVFRDITERKQAEVEIAQRNANLAAQNTIATALSRSIELETILDTVLDAVLSVVEMHVALVFLWDSSLEELALRSYRGPVVQHGPRRTKREWNCCSMVSMEAMKLLQAVVKPVSECPAAHGSPMIARNGLETLVSVPLVSNNRAVGALTLGSQKTSPVQPQDLELLTIIGQQIGMAIENAHLYHKAEKAAEELALLHRISIDLTSTFSTETIYTQIVEQSIKLLNCQTACILDWDEEEQAVRLIACQGLTEAESNFIQTQPDASGCLRDLISCRKSALIDNTQGDTKVPPAWREKLNIRALLCVPIQSRNASFGALFLMNRRSARRWRYEEQALTESFVNRAALALMNANLVKQLEWAAALEERQSIAADMHDGLAQTVSLLGLQIDGAMELITTGSGPKAIKELSITRETVKQVSIAVRQSIASLQRTPQPRQSLQEMLTNLPEQLTRESGPPIDFIFKVQEPLFLPQEQANQALLVMQEALLNACHHAHAQQIMLILDRRDQEVSMSVEDDGIGLEPGAWWENGQDHFGLGIMHSRAARIGAKLQIDSASGKGTRVLLILPLISRNNNAKLVSVSQDAIHQTPIKQGVHS
jgi:PAS domain S-box-containing protein